MNDIILKILDIEKKAQRITENIKTEHDHMKEIISEQVKALENDVTGRARAKIEKLENDNEIYRQKRCEEIQIEGEKRIAELEKKGNELKSEWADAIFNNIIHS